MYMSYHFVKEIKEIIICEVWICWLKICSVEEAPPSCGAALFLPDHSPGPHLCTEVHEPISAWLAWPLAECTCSKFGWGSMTFSEAMFFKEPNWNA